MNISTGHDKTVFENFLSIESGSYRDIVHFYEDYRDQVYWLDIKQRFEIQVCYVEALFEMGKFREVLVHIDDVIENAIIFNFSRLYDIDIYFNLLLKKSISLYQTGQYDEAYRLTHQLLIMDNKEPNARHFFKSLLLRQSRKLVVPTRVFFISGLLTTTVLMAFELLVIWPFYNEVEPVISKVRNIIFLISIFVFAAGEAGRYLLMEWHAHVQFRRLKKLRSFPSISQKSPVKSGK